MFRASSELASVMEFGFNKTLKILSNNFILTWSHAFTCRQSNDLNSEATVPLYCSFDQLLTKHFSSETTVGLLTYAELDALATMRRINWRFILRYFNNLIFSRLHINRNDSTMDNMRSKPVGFGHVEFRLPV